MPLSRLRLSWLIAALLGLLVAASVGIGNMALLRGADRESLPILTETTEAGAEAVGRAVAAQLSRALGYGIPLPRLNGVDTYLQRIIDGSPQVEALAILDEAGAVMFSTREDVRGLRFPIHAGANRAGFLVLEVAPPGAGSTLPRLELGLAAITLFCGFMAAIASHLFLRHYILAAEQRLGAMLAAMHDNRFETSALPAGRGVVATTFRAVERALEPLRRAEQRLDDAIATVRAIDFDGSLKPRLDNLLKEHVDAVTTDARITPSGTSMHSGDGALPWRAAIIIGSYCAAAPLIANYAADREWPLVSPAWWPSLPVIAEVLAVSAAAALAAKVSAATRTFLSVAGIALAAIATGAVAFSTGYEPFLVLRMAAGLGFGLILGSTFAGRPGSDWAPAAWRLVLFAGLCAGPFLGGILAEAIGRRSAFLALGVLLAFGVVIVTRTKSDHSDAPERGWDGAPRRVPILAGLGVLIGAFALVWIPMVPGYEHYLEGGVAIAALGLVVLLVEAILRLPAPRRPAELYSLPMGIIAGASGLSLLGTYGNMAAAAMLVLVLALVALGLTRKLSIHGPARTDATRPG